MKKILLLLYAFFVSTPLLFANGDPDSTKLILERMKALEKYQDSVNHAMHYETGSVMLPGDIAKLNIPKGFKYLGAEQSKFVIKDVWGNPERDDVLGMIFPENGSPIDDSSYAFIISFDDMGYVKDNDADKIDYKELLDEWHKGEPEINAERKAQGYSSIHMVGWAQPPFYDSKNKVLHWAKELQFGDQEGSTLNYDVRILGRKGILSLNAVATMDQFPMVKKDINQILAIPEFTDGNRYADFNDNTDKIAAYTVGGLVAGKVLLKIGFFAKFWKLILLAFAAIGGWIAKLFKNRKKERDIAYQSAPPSSTDTTIPS